MLKKISIYICIMIYEYAITIRYTRKGTNYLSKYLTIKDKLEAVDNLLIKTAFEDTKGLHMHILLKSPDELTKRQFKVLCGISGVRGVHVYFEPATSLFANYIKKDKWKEPNLLFHEYMREQNDFEKKILEEPELHDSDISIDNDEVIFKEKISGKNLFLANGDL